MFGPIAGAVEPPAYPLRVAGCQRVEHRHQQEGVGAVATWADGTADSAALTYVQLECDPGVWWQWLVRLLAVLARPLSAATGAAASRQGGR